jgi:hypothetical protein
VLRHLDVVLFDRSCPVLEARTFVDILRTNPRTDTIPVIVTASAEEADEAMRDARGAASKTYNLDGSWRTSTTSSPAPSAPGTTPPNRRRSRVPWPSSPSRLATNARLPGAPAA